MKTSIWNILTAVVLFGILCMVAGFSFLLLNPGLTTGTPQMTIPTISLPTATATVPGLPPTWTPPAPPPAVATSTLRPTATLFPTNTPVILPTFTASPRARSSGGSGGGSGGGNCSVTFQQPSDNSYQDPNSPFQMRWVLKNNSDKTWDSDNIDIRFVSGDRMGAADRDLHMDVPPGGQVDIIMNMVTPSGSGNVASNWGLFEGGTSVCRFYVDFNIK